MKIEPLHRRCNGSSKRNIEVETKPFPHIITEMRKEIKEGLNEDNENQDQKPIRD